LFKSWSPGVGRGHNKENYMCLHWKQSSPPEPAVQIPIKFGTNHPWVKRIENNFKRRVRFFSKGR
jgi:hypothetical protein